MSSFVTDPRHVQYENDTLRAENERLKAERDEARTLVTEANNSLYGSQGYFHSMTGGEFDPHHLSRGIEKLKEQTRIEWQQTEALRAENKQLQNLLRDANRGAELNSKVNWLVTDTCAALRARVANIQQVVDEQANDMGLWFLAETAAEGYLQQELRRLHAIIEGDAAIRREKG